MMRVLAMAALLSLSASAFGASLPELRTQVSSGRGRLEQLQARRTELQRSLGDLAQRIEARKSKQVSNKRLFQDPELDGLLKSSQALSDELAGLLRQESDERDALQAREGEMVRTLDAQIGELRKRWDSTSNREARRALVPQIRALRSERDALLRAQPSVELPAVSDRPSDDPEELLDRADALFDSEDKLRREERALATRISQLHSERELERRMNDFLQENALFDEHDRRIAVSGRAPQGYSTEAAADKAPAAGGPTAPSTQTTTPPNTSGSPTSPPAETFNDGALAGGRSTVGSADTTARTSSNPGSQPGLEPLSDSGTRGGVSRTPPSPMKVASPYAEDETLEQLEARRAQMRALAEELHRRAEQTVKRARELR